MSIGNIGGGTGPVRDRGKSDGVGKTLPATNATPAPGGSQGARAEHRDRTEFSSAALRLVENHDERNASPQMETEEIQRIRDLIAEGHYNSPEVVDAILKGVMAEFERARMAASSRR